METGVCVSQFNRINQYQCGKWAHLNACLQMMMLLLMLQNMTDF